MSLFEKKNQPPPNPVKNWRIFEPWLRQHLAWNLLSVQLMEMFTASRGSTTKSISCFSWTSELMEMSFQCNPRVL
jgi:hypothetical protein